MGTLVAESINKKRIAKNTVLLYVRMAFNMLVAFYTSRILLSILGVDDYGIYNVVGGVVAIFAFLNGALGGATSRFITFDLGRKDPENLSKTFSAALVCHLFIGVIIVSLAEILGLYLFNYKMIIPESSKNAALWVFHFSVASTFLTMTQIPYNACIIAHERMNAFAYIGIMDTLLRLGIVLILKFFFDSNRLFLYGLLILVLTFVITACYRIYCLRNFSECKLRFTFDKERTKTLFAYAGWDFIGSFSAVAQGQGLNVLLNTFFGPAVNAARAISVQVNGAVGQFSNNFMMAVRPQIIKAYANNKIEEMMNLVYLSAKYGFIMVLFIVLPLMMETNYVLKVWLKDVPAFASSFCKILLLVSLINVWRNPFIVSLHATGNIRLANLICGTILVSTLPISYVLLKMGAEPTSVFWATLIITGIVLVIDLINLKRFLPISLIRHFEQVVFPCMSISAVVGLTLFFMQKVMLESACRLFWVACVSSIELCLMSYLFVLDKDSRKKINQKLRKITHARTYFK